MICSLCYLIKHRRHNYKILKQMGSEIKTHFKSDIEELGYVQHKTYFHLKKKSYLR